MCTEETNISTFSYYLLIHINCTNYLYCNRINEITCYRTAYHITLNPFNCWCTLFFRLQNSSKMAGLQKEFDELNKKRQKLNLLLYVCCRLETACNFCGFYSAKMKWFGLTEAQLIAFSYIIMAWLYKKLSSIKKSVEQLNLIQQRQIFTTMLGRFVSTFNIYICMLFSKALSEAIKIYRSFFVYPYIYIYMHMRNMLQLKLSALVAHVFVLYCHFLCAQCVSYLIIIHIYLSTCFVKLGG